MIYIFRCTETGYIICATADARAVQDIEQKLYAFHNGRYEVVKLPDISSRITKNCFEVTMNSNDGYIEDVHDVSNVVTAYNEASSEPHVYINVPRIKYTIVADTEEEARKLAHDYWIDYVVRLTLAYNEEG